MKQKLSLTLGIMVLVMVVLASNPAKAVSPTEKGIVEALDTLQNSVDNIPPAWSQKLSATQRFELVLDGAAVLDRETGLVWQRTLNTISSNWYYAWSGCHITQTGFRMGWRLPTVQELQSLVDPSVGPPNISLPNGHPFIHVSSLPGYWTATSVDSQLSPTSSMAYRVTFNYGVAAATDKSSWGYYYWCVRGGQGGDPQGSP